MAQAWQHFKVVASRVPRMKYPVRLLLSIVVLTLVAYSCSTSRKETTSSVHQHRDRPYKLIDICGKQHEDHPPNIDDLNHLIYGGPANQHSWPWVVFLLQTRKYGGQVKVISHCAATLIPLENNEIESDILVTSAACVTEFKLNKGESLLGKAVYRNEKEFDAYFDLYQMQPPSQLGASIKVKKFFHHKDYYGKPHKFWSEFQNDIALVKLETPIKFSGKVRPICLPKQSAETPMPGVKCIEVGWGTELTTGEFLGEIEVTVKEEKTCKDSGPPAPGTLRKGWGDSYIHEMLFCTVPSRFENPGTAGSPLVCYDDQDKRWKVYGIMHYGSTWYSSEHGGLPLHLYTRVSSYANWIEDNISAVRAM